MNKIACHKSNFSHFLIILHFAYEKKTSMTNFKNELLLTLKN